MVSIAKLLENMNRKLLTKKQNVMNKLSLLIAHPPADAKHI